MMRAAGLLLGPFYLAPDSHMNVELLAYSFQPPTPSVVYYFCFDVCFRCSLLEPDGADSGDSSEAY